MRSFVVSILVGFNLWAGEPTVYRVYLEKKSTPGKQYLAVIDDGVSDAFSMIIFGEKKKIKRLRHFDLKEGRFAKLKTNTGEDVFYRLSYRNNEEDGLLSVELKAKRGKTRYKLNYIRSRDAAPLKKAQIAAETYAAYLKRKEEAVPKNLAEFKDLLDRIVKRTNSVSIQDLSDYEAIPVFDLQIEASWKKTPADRNLAVEQIDFKKADDRLSRLLEVKRWYSEKTLPIDMKEGETYYAVRDLASTGFRAKNLKATVGKFVRYEIVGYGSFECEDNHYDFEKITWVLSDGSTYTYEPALECD